MRLTFPNGLSNLTSVLTETWKGTTLTLLNFIFLSVRFAVSCFLGKGEESNE